MTAAEQQEINRRRDRLLASIALSTGLGLILALPFALRAGAEFFLPLTAALVIAIALVPLLEWMERRGLPSGLAALLAVIGFLVVANTALVLIVVPATDWFSALPQRLPQIQANLAPVIDFYANLQRFVDETVQMLATGPVAAAQTAAVEAPRSLLQFAATSAPAAIIQMVFALLIIYFFLAGWTRLRRRTINSRGSFDGAMAVARVAGVKLYSSARFCRPISSTSSRPRLVTSTVRAPLFSSAALVATVVPCTITSSPAARASLRPISSMPRRIACSGAEGEESTL